MSELTFRSSSVQARSDWPCQPSGQLRRPGTVSFAASAHLTGPRASTGDRRMPAIPRLPPTLPKGASVIYQCLGAHYTEWPKLFPPLQRAVLIAAEHTGALLVSLENLYGYGPTDGAPMTETLALTPHLQGASPSGHDRRAVGRGARAGFASPSDGPRTSSAPAPPSRHSERGFSATPWRTSAPTSSAIPICPTPTATFPTSRPAWPSSAPTSGCRTGVASPRARNRHHPGSVGADCRRGRAIRSRSVRCPSWSYVLSDW